MNRLMCCAIASLVFALGCHHDRGRLSLYEPVGASEQDLPSLSLGYLSRYFVYEPPAITGEILKETQGIYLQNLGDALSARPRYASFRALCAVANSYFGKWNRLVIIERISFGYQGYEFIIVASTPAGLKGVTNLELTLRGDWRSQAERLQRFDPQHKAFEKCLAEMDMARAVLPQVLLWYQSIDWPVYAVHDIKRDGSTFAFAVSGYRVDKDPGMGTARNADAFPAATQLLDGLHPHWFVSDGTPEGRKLRAVGGVYARLLAGLWRSALGQPDDCLLGQD